MKYTKKTSRLALVLTSEQFSAIEKAARAEEVSISQLVRQACKAYIATYDLRKSPAILTRPVSAPPSHDELKAKRDREMDILQGKK